MPTFLDFRVALPSFLKTILFLPVFLLSVGFSSFAAAQVSISPNPSTTGSFTISWPNSSGHNVVVSETSNGNTIVYEGSGSSVSISGKPNGEHTYTVFDLVAQQCHPFVGCFPLSLGTATVTVALAIKPPTPTGLTAPASDNNGSYTVSWNAASHATSYTLQRRINSGSWSTIQNTSARSRNESGLGNGTYSYRVRACNSAGCSAYSSTRTTTVLHKPGTPGAISTPATSFSGDYTVSWGAASGVVTTYTLQERVDSGSWSTIQNTSARSRSITGKLNGAYSYRVRACNSSGCSAFTAVKTTQVSILLNVSASPNPSTTGNVTLSWDHTVIYADYYQVFDVTGGGRVYKMNATTGQAQLTGLSNGNYTFLVEGVINSPDIGTITLPLGEAPVAVAIVVSVPTLSAPSVDSDGAFTVSWSGTTGASYTLQRQYQNGGWSTIYSGSATQRSQSGLGVGYYDYRVRGCINGTCSAYSSVKTTRVVEVPGVPGSISAPVTTTSSSYRVSWGTSSGVVDNYMLQERPLNQQWVTVHNGAASYKDLSGRGDGAYDYRVRACVAGICSAYTAEHRTVIYASATITASPNPSTTGNVNLSWDPVNGATSYYVVDSFGGSATQLGYTNTSSMSLTNQQHGEHQYSVWRTVGGGPAGDIDVPVGTVTVNVVLTPGIPTGVSSPSTDDNGNYSVNWNTASGSVDYYRLQERVDGGAWNLIEQPSGTQSTITGRQNGTYVYRVSACNSYGCSAYSSSTSTTTVSLVVLNVPGPISGPSTSNTGNYTLSWTAASGNVVRYILQERVNSGAWNQIVNANVLSHALSGKAEASYSYRVAACYLVDGQDTCGNFTGEKTVVVSIPDIPGVVGSITAPQTSTSGNYTVFWESASGIVDTYMLQERINGGSWSAIQDNADLSRVFSGKTDATYDYRVRACNVSGCGNYSSVVTTLVSTSQTVGERSDESDTPAAKPAVSSSLITASENVGSIQGEFRVNESGAASYTVPLKVGAGTAGVAPQLALNYSSQGASGMLGKGWSLSGLSAITRCRQTLGQDGAAKPITWTSQDRFCLDGQRLVLVSGTYGASGSTYKTETDSFVTVTAEGNVATGSGYFSAETKDGSLSLYGETANAKVLTPDSQHVLSWAQSEFRDSVGNPIEFIYRNAGRGQHIDRINYAFGPNDSSASPGAYIQFNYDGDDRSDARETYISGYAFPQKVLLDSITAYSDGEVLRHYHMEYAYSSLNNVPKLEYLHECAEYLSVPSSSSCLNPTEFSWTEDLSGFNRQLPVENFTGSSNAGLYGWKPADINGDGMMDIVWMQWQQRSEDVEFQMRYMLSGDGELKEMTFTNMSVVTFNDVGINNSLKMEIIDYNADGRQDVMVFNSQTGGWSVYLSTLMPAGDWRLSSNRINLGIASREVFLTDANSDGLVDVVYVDRDDAHKLFVRLLEHDPSQGLGSNRYYHFGSPIDLNFNPVPAGTEEGKQSPLTLDLFLYNFFSAGDFNGDGNGDFYLNKTSAGCAEIIGCVNHHQGWIVTLHSDSAGNVSANYTYQGEIGDMLMNDEATRSKIFFAMQPFDVNGDGLSEVLYQKKRFDVNGERSWFYRLNTGGEYGEEQEFLYVPASDDMHYGMQFVDYNQDAAIDVVWADTDNGYLKVRYGDGIGGFAAEESIHYIGTSGGNEAHILLDMNGDARSDYVHIWDNKLQVAVAQGSLQPAGVITRITNGLGGVTDIDYGSLAVNGNYERIGASTNDVQICLPNDLTGNSGSLGCTDYTYTVADANAFYTALNADWDLPDGSHGFGRDKPVLEFNGSMTVVTRVTGSAPVHGDANATSSISYHYGEAKVQASGRGMLGFQAIKTVDEQTGIETTTTYRQDYPFIGYPLSTVVRAPRQAGEDGPVLSAAQNIWHLKNFNGVNTTKPYQPYIAESVQVSYGLEEGGLLQGEALQTFTTVSTYDDYGNPASISVTTEGDSDTLVKTTVNQYGSTVWEREKGRLSRTDVTTTRGSESETRSSTYTYYPSGDLRGLLHTEVIEPGHADALTKTYEYDSMGNIERVTRSAVGEEPRYTRSEYDALGRYVDKRYNSLGHLTASVITRNHFGGATHVHDINGVSAENEYDRFGSQYLSYRETGTGQITLRSWCVSNCGIAGGVYKIEQRSSDSSLANKIIVFDVLGRKIRESALLFNGTYSHVDIGYDEAGRVERQSEPHTGTATDWTITEFDLIGRPTTISAPADTGVGSIITYEAYTTVTTNDKGQSKTEIKNAFGELVEVVDDLGARVTYEYDPLGNLKAAVSHGSTIDPHNIRVSMDYDVFGRKVWLDDPDKGYWQYDYNAFGELEVQTDAKLQTSTMTYDRLGRIATRIDRNASGVIEGDTYWFYDTAANGLGQLDNVVDLESGYAQFYHYDNYGRPLKVVTSHDDSGAFDYTTQTVYDQYSRIKRRYDAFDRAAVFGGIDGSGIHNYYNQYGQLSHIVDLVSNDEVYRVNAQNARGQLTSISLGNGSTATYDYDSQTGRLRGQFASTLTGTQIQSVEYDWDSVGNLDYRHNTSGSRDITETFEYDTLNRLETSTLSGPGISTSVNSVTYNSIGNIRTKTGIGLYTYGQNGAGPHAVSSTADGVSYYYDANGNLTSDTAVGNLGGRTITYTTFDKPSLITKGNHSVAFQYGPDRTRYLKTDTNSANGTVKETRYLGSVERITTSGSNDVQWKRTINGVAIYTTSTNSAGDILSTDKSYIYKDHLGSTDIITDGNASITQEMSFDAWGQRRNVDTWLALDSSALLNFDHSITTRGFTGHEMLDQVGLVHMNGRIYDARLGRFMQADPFVDGVTNTQGYNRYSYLTNNPLNATDPTGFFKLRQWVGFIVAVVGGIICGPACAQMGWQVVVLGAVSGAAGAAANGGNIFQGAIMGAITAGAFSGIAGADFSGWGAFAGVAKFAAFGVVGGITSTISGGKFGHGFISAGVGGMVGGSRLASTSGTSGQQLGRLLVRMVIAGTVSKLTGGKFANGAGSTAFSWAVTAATADDVLITAKKKDGNTPVVTEDTIVVRPEVDYSKTYDSAGEAKEALNTAILDAKTNGKSSWEYGGITVQQTVDGVTKFYNSNIVTSQEGDFIAWSVTHLLNINAVSPLIMLHHYHPSGFDAIYKEFSDGDMKTYHVLKENGADLLQGVYMVDKYGPRVYNGGKSDKGISCRGDIASC